MLKRIFSPPNERGQGLVEYAMILTLVSVIVILILTVFGGTVREFYCDIVREFDPYFGTGIPGICEEEEEESTEAPVAVVWQVSPFE